MKRLAHNKFAIPLATTCPEFGLCVNHPMPIFKLLPTMLLIRPSMVVLVKRFHVVMIQSLLLVGHCIQQTTLVVILTAFVLILKCVLKVLHRVLKILAKHLETIFKRFTCFANPKIFSMDPPLLAKQVVNPLNAQLAHLDNFATTLHPHKRYNAQTMLKLSLGLGFIQLQH